MTRAEEPRVRLSNLRWSVDRAHFEETVSIILDIEIPEALKEITRVIVTVFALSKTGKREHIKSKELWAKEGKVQGDFILMPPRSRDEKENRTYPYLFVAKHRDSKEAESPQLPVQEKEGGKEELILEIPNSVEVKKTGNAFRLRSKDGSVNSKVEVNSGEEKDDSMIIKFSKLDAKLHYTLEELDKQGNLVCTIFSEKLFGKWDEVEK